MIGINTAIADPTGKGASSGVGFAIPIDMAKGLVSQILEFGRVMRPALGISLAPPQLAKQLGVEGVIVLDAPPSSPAGKAGVRGTTRDPIDGSLTVGDSIVGIDGAPVRNFTDLYDLLDSKAVGQRIKLQILRGSRAKLEVDVVLGERDIGRSAE